MSIKAEIAELRIEEQLQKITKIKPKDDEDRQEYLVRLIKAILLVGDGWDDLSLDAQDFANKMIRANNAFEEIPEFPDSSTADKDENMQTALPNGVGTTPHRKAKKPPPKKDLSKKSAATPSTKKKKVVGKPAAKPVKKVPAKVAARAPREKETGIKYRIKKLIIKDPAISAEGIEAALKKEGLAKPSKFTVAAIRSEFRHSLGILRDYGWPKIKL